MKLSEYMKAAGLDDEAFAALVGGCSSFAVKKWRYGERVPRSGQMRRILDATNGAVTPNDLLPVSRPPTPAPSPEQAA